MSKGRITGIGMITALGDSLDIVWRKICEGESGLSVICNFDTSNCSNNRAGEIKANFPTDTVDRMVEFASAAIRNCIADAGVGVEMLNSRKTIAIFGSSLGAIFQQDATFAPLDQFAQASLDKVGLSIPHLTVSSACSSGSDAILMAADLIEFSEYDIVLCGGVDVLDIYKLKGHSSLHTLSSTLCRPFDKDSNGTLLGEGACFFLLQSSEREMYSEKNYGELIGRCNTTDLQNLTAPSEDAEGPLNCIKGALLNAGKTPGDVAYINAHGSGTKANDDMEYKIYSSLFMPYQTPISSTKGAFGHLLGATGALEAAVAVMALNHHEAPLTTNCIAPKEEWKDTGLIYKRSAKICEEGVTLSVTYGFGGTNVCLVFGK